jgi:hypothetical protein
MNGFQSGMDEEDWSMPNGSDSLMPGAFAPPDAGDGQIIDLDSRRPNLQVVPPPAASSQPESIKAQDMTPVVAPRAPDPSPYRQPPHPYPALPAPKQMIRPAAIPLSALPHPSAMPRPRMPMAPMHAMGSPDMAQQNVNASADAVNPDVADRGHMLGVTTVAAGLGAVLGLRFGGLYGSVAGTLFAGSAVNGYRAVLHGMRADPGGKKEAMISGTYALISAGLGGYLVYRMKKEGLSKATPNTSDSDEPCATKNGRRSCGIRAIV